MKTQVLLFLLLTPLLTNSQSKEAQSVLKKTIEIMKANSVNSKIVDWTNLTTEAYQLAKNAKRPEDLGNSIRFLLQSLGDFHGRFRYNDSIFRWAREKVVAPEVYKKEFVKKGNRFFTKLLDKAGYLRIPSIDQQFTKEMAQTWRFS